MISNKVKHLGILILFLALAVSANSQDEPDPAARAIALTASELPDGFEYIGEMDISLQAGTQLNYPALLQQYSVETPRGRLSMDFVYAALESKHNAAVAFHRFPASIKSGRYEENIVGDDTWGEYPTLTCFLQDRAVVQIHIRTSRDYDAQGLDEETLAATIAPYTESLVDAVVQKLNSLGYQKSAPFDLNLVVASDVAGSFSEVDATLSGQDPSVFPLKFNGQVRAQDTSIVYRFEEYESTSGEFTYRWDGLDAAGLRVPPGHYDLELEASDVFGRLASESLPITVVELEPPPGPDTQTLPATKDALVYERNPHSNEGANPKLTLDKITGKAARNLIGFDLAGVDTNSLTGATLVLSIDPSDQVTGWGNGETVTVKPVTVSWQEGNGKKQGLPNNQQTTGSGSGTTWFSPADENVANNSSDSVVQWNGGAIYATSGAAPALTVQNHQTGELRFNVTQDVKNGALNGWLLRKDSESKGSKVSFYSREGGGADLGPRLILEYGGPTARSGPGQIYSAVAGFFGFKSRPVSLQASAGVSEGPGGLKKFLRASPRSAFVGEQVMLGFVGRHPLTQLGARVVYRSWLRETPSLV